ncbi:hypothetical protein [Clostridiisalibacter paucivorans]|uniref:hypothetical protein n=1 Tax=Clostridiisalibacter paucivorans TaxID=408753 RepID=UPI00047DD9FC|nr:hypothetical protein [Clostridiisalibacter paucivorans]
MKKFSFIFILIIALAFTACSPKEEPSESKTPESEETSIDSTEETTKEDIDNIMSEYDSLLSGNVTPADAVIFIDENIHKLPKEYADELIVKLESLQDSFTEKYMNELFTNNYQKELMSFSEEEINSDDIIDKIPNEELKEKIIKMKKGHFKFFNLEGDYYPFINHSALKKYKEYLSEDINAYIDLMSKESNEIMTRDAALAISWEELADRTITTEKFLVKYPNAVRHEQIMDLYYSYITSYMYGLSNTPIFSWEDNKILDEVKDSYENIISEYPDSLTSEIIKKHLLKIENNNYIINDKIFENGNKVHDLIKEKFE